MVFIYSKLLAAPDVLSNSELVKLGNDLCAGYWRHSKPAYRLGHFLANDESPLDPSTLAELCFNTLNSSASEKRKNFALGILGIFALIPPFFGLFLINVPLFLQKSRRCLY